MTEANVLCQSEVAEYQRSNGNDCEKHQDTEDQPAAGLAAARRKLGSVLCDCKYEAMNCYKWEAYFTSSLNSGADFSTDIF